MSDGFRLVDDRYREKSQYDLIQEGTSNGSDSRKATYTVADFGVT